MGATRRFLGFDYGTRSLGIAVGSSTSGQAEALTTASVKNHHPDWSVIDRLVAEWRPDALIVGLPLNMDDSESEMTRAARKFGQRLAGRYNLPVEWVDERLTSVDAQNAMVEAHVPWKQRKRQVDQLAARSILQAYLDESRHAPREPRHDADE